MIMVHFFFNCNFLKYYQKSFLGQKLHFLGLGKSFLNYIVSILLQAEPSICCIYTSTDCCYLKGNNYLEIQSLEDQFSSVWQ